MDSQTGQDMTNEAKGILSNVNAVLDKAKTGLKGIGAQANTALGKAKEGVNAGLTKANAGLQSVKQKATNLAEDATGPKEGAVPGDARASFLNGVGQAKEEGKKALSKAKQAMKDAKEFAINVEIVRKQVANSSGQEKKNLQGQLKRKEIELKKKQEAVQRLGRSDWKGGKRTRRKRRRKGKKSRRSRRKKRKGRKSRRSRRKKRKGRKSRRKKRRTRRRR